MTKKTKKPTLAGDRAGAEGVTMTTEYDPELEYNHEPSILDVLKKHDQAHQRRALSLGVVGSDRDRNIFATKVAALRQALMEAGK